MLDVKIYAKTVEQEAIEQIYALAAEKYMKDTPIRIMPDTHAGKGCTIGTTFPIVNAQVSPNLVGVDIGCGMFVVPLGDHIPELEDIDKVVSSVPSGFEVHSLRRFEYDFSDLYMYDKLENIQRLELSLGTLGGGNHFIEIDKTDDEYYLVIHSGSRNLGLQVAKYYQSLAAMYHGDEVIVKDNAFLDGELYKQYLHDMDIAQSWAVENRVAIAFQLKDLFGYDKDYLKAKGFHTVHNYIDLSGNIPILRKGAISAKAGEQVLIPMNMRDGSLLCIGKGNPDWNYSAPHGAGRLMSRSQARKNISFEDFQQSMSGIYSNSIVPSVIDEAPMVYKPAEEIKSLIVDTVDIKKILYPIYNYKAH